MKPIIFVSPGARATSHQRQASIIALWEGMARVSLAPALPVLPPHVVAVAVAQSEGAR